MSSESPTAIVYSMNTTDEQIIKLTVNKLAYLLVSVIIVTNTVSLTVQRVSNNQEMITYIDNANKRRLGHAIKEQDYKHQIQSLKEDIKNKDQDLREAIEDIMECKDKSK